MTRGTRSRTHRSSIAASSAPSRPRCPASACATCLPRSARIMDKWVDRPQPAPPRRGALDRRPDLLHRLQRRARCPTRTSTRRCGSIVSKQLGHTDAAPAGLRDDPANGPRHRPGVPRRGAQAVRDAGRPGRRPARSRCRTSRCRRGSRSNASATARACCDRFDAVAHATWTPPASSTPSTAISRRRGTSSLRRRRATRSTSTASRCRSASGTASCPRSTRRRPTAAAARPGASASCSPAGWSRPASGW